MIFYAVCDQDGYYTNDPDEAEAHFLANPSHTSHFGAGGNVCYPIPYSSGSSTIPQVTVDPVSPVAGQTWILASGTVGAAGQAMGVLGLTYSRSEVAVYQFSIKMANGDIKRMVLS